MQVTEEKIEELHREYIEVPAILKKFISFEGYIILRECSEKSEIVKTLKKANEKAVKRAAT